MSSSEIRDLTNPYYSTTLKAWEMNDGDLTLDTINKTPTFISGLRNVAQSIERCILTNQTSNSFFPSLGLDYQNYFKNLNSFTREEQEEVFALYVQRAIAEGTDFGDYVHDIKVSRSKQDERILKVEVFISVQGQDFSVELNTQLTAQGQRAVGIEE